MMIISCTFNVRRAASGNAWGGVEDDEPRGHKGTFDVHTVMRGAKRCLRVSKPSYRLSFVVTLPAARSEYRVQQLFP